jgi:Zn-dependent peptidase ImmA (M78 family)/transcriptional regulator with XRE-family HTH domain
MNAKVIGQNLKRIRLSQGKTQETLAREAGISLPGLRNFESGKNAPKVDVLLSLGDALGVGFSDLITEVKMPQAIRFRAQKKLKTREQIILESMKRLNGFNEVEDLLKQWTKFNKKIGVSGKTGDALAQEIRKELKLGDQPIYDICGIFEKLGVKVLPMVFFSDSFFGMAIGEEDGGPAVVINVWERIPVERWIFSAAHELGHILMHPSSFKVQEENEDPDSNEEKEANKFTSYLLMPKTRFDDEWDKSAGLPFLDRVFKVKRLFRVSYATILYRLKDNYPGNIWPMFYGHFKRKYNRSLTRKEEPQSIVVTKEAGEEPKRLDAVDFFEDRTSRLVREALEKSLISRDRGAEILGISPEEIMDRIEDWKNEN